MQRSVNLIKNESADDIIIQNYMALLACILNPKLSSSSALKFFNISDSDEIDSYALQKSKTNRISKCREIKVLDTFTNEELLFKSVYEAEEYTGIKRESIYVYIKRNILGKRRFKFRY